MRVGVVGLGRSGYGIHLKTFQRLPALYQVVGVADTDAARCRETSAEFDCAAHPGLDALLADPKVELVVVATPNYLHAPYTVQALQAGKHVVCEKPFGLTVADVDAMIAAAGGDRILAPFQNRRFEESFLKVRAVLQSGLLGRIVHIRIAYHAFGRRWDWQTLQKFGGGQLNNNLPHPVDQGMALLEDFGVRSPDDLEVFADLENALSSGDAEDHVRITLRAPAIPAAPTMDIEFTAACPYPQDRWLVMGTAGGLRGTGKRLTWKWVDWSGLPPRPVDERSTPDRGYNRETLPWQEDAWDGDESARVGHDPFYENLFRAIREREPLAVTPESVRRRIAILEKARSAASERRGA